MRRSDSSAVSVSSLTVRCATLRLRRLHEQPPQTRVAAPADPELRFALPRVALPRHESEVGGGLPVLREAGGILDRQHERERGDRAHAGDLAQRRGLGMSLAQRLNLPADCRWRGCCEPCTSTARSGSGRCWSAGLATAARRGAPAGRRGGAAGAARLQGRGLLGRRLRPPAGVRGPHLWPQFALARRSWPSPKPIKPLETLAFPSGIESPLPPLKPTSATSRASGSSIFQRTRSPAPSPLN